MRKRKHGLLTERQYTVLKLRLQGYTQEEIAKLLNTSRENVSIIEKKAKENIRIAKETLDAYNELLAVGEIIIEPGTHLAEIPAIVVRKADEMGIKLKTNFTRLYDEIRYNTNAAKGTTITKRIKILVLKDGSFRVIPA